MTIAIFSCYGFSVYSLNKFCAVSLSRVTVLNELINSFLRTNALDQLATAPFESANKLKLDFYLVN